ncbi:MAG: hypothetical protein K0M70_11985 [Arenimonas sp.]|uniref:hypothetical protein n=1 Tax=Arenimonas sp. TaxID=1872635 RepID=UPI0025BDA38F|nr:hypothetical protein [Arenimonas sp.]MBW8368560.1 hypothetical protein [Arenimonas sp.]
MSLSAWLMIAGTAVAQPAYAPVGVQQNIPEATATGGGWTTCYSNNFSGTPATPVADILAACTDDRIMLACRPVGNPNFTLLAQAERTAVFLDTGNPTTNPGGFNIPTVANGVGWYFNDSWSYGFAPAGEPISRNSCDIGVGTVENLRMCVHTEATTVANYGGYRCGTTTLNGNATWEHVILQAPNSPPGVTLTVPGSNSPVPVAEELILPPERTLANPAGRLNLLTEVGYAFSSGEVRYARLHCPGAEFTTASVIDFTGDPSNTIGSVNGLGSDAIFFSITAGATPVIATDGFTVDGTRTVGSQADVDCTYGLYDFPSQAQAGGPTGRVAASSGAYLRFNPSYALVVDSQAGAVADVESDDPAYSQFVVAAPTSSTDRAQIGGFSYGTVQAVLGDEQPITLDGLAVELADLTGANTALRFAGDFDSAGDVFFSPNANCAVNIQSANAFDDTGATFVIGAAAKLDHFLCFEVSGDPIPVSDYTVALAPVSAAPAVYAVTPRGPLALGAITRNGAELQAPLAQVPNGYLSRMVLTNTGSQAREYVIEVLGETGNVISTANLTGTVAAGKTLVVDLNSVLTGFTAAPRATLNVTVSGPNKQIQGLYQIVNPESGTVSNHVMVRPGTN